MVTLNGRKLLLGGIHDHFSRADAENPAVFLAALNYYHYDFVTMMCGPRADTRLQAVAAAFTDCPKLYLGREEMFGWAHVVTVNPTAPALSSADPDFRGVLRKLQQTCDLVILGHPTYIAWESLFETGQLDGLLDDGLLDGIQFTADMIDQPDSREQKLLQWYQQREARGRRTAMVSGWDLHFMKNVTGIPPALYSRQFIPDGHYEAPCSSRTIVFAEENTLPAICQAIRAGQSVMERLPDGRLYGPADLVHFLEHNGYREAIAEMDRKRDAVTLTVSSPLKAGQPGQMTVSQSGRLQLPVSLSESQTVEVEANEPFAWPQVPAILQRDQMYLPVMWEGMEGQRRIWAVESEHPIQLDVLPLVSGGPAAMEVVPLRPFEGEVTVKMDGQPPRRQKVNGRTRLDVLIPEGQQILSYELTAEHPNGTQRSFAGQATFFGVAPFHGDWHAIPKFGVDQPQFSPATAYGKGREWPGPQEYSAQLQFAWTPNALMLRATVTDAIHYQPFRGHYTYNADCLQLGIDPLLRRKQTLGNTYAFNLALTPQGPELYRTWAPDHEATASFTPPKPDVSLGDRYLSIRSWAHGLIYEMALPWTELAPAPARPAPGHRLGIYYIMFNNNGTGHIDTLHWPIPLTGRWTNPARWGVLTLL